MKHFFKKTAFTFVETLVVVALFSVIAVILFSSFTAGMKVWKRSATFNYGERKAMLGLEKISRELRQTILYAPIGFWGEKDSINFANSGQEKIWNISYRYEDDKKQIGRRAWVYGLNLSQDEEKERLVVPKVKECVFSYYGYNSEKKEFEFLESWNFTKSGIPRAVKVNLASEDGKSFEKIIEIPVGQ